MSALPASMPHWALQELYAKQRGYSIAFRSAEKTACPGCGRSHWLVGRILAECAFCGTALPIEQSRRAG